MRRKKRKTKIKFVFKLVLLLMVVASVIFLSFKFFSKPIVDAPKVVDSIEEFMYTLDDRDTALMKETYNELKTVLKSDTINYEEYAKVLTKMFIIDLFTIDNKANKYDVGGSEYVYPSAVANYKMNAMDTLYKLVNNYTDGKRKQELPVVKSIEVKDIKKGTFTIGEDKELDSFDIELSWEYEKDLGYDKTGVVTTVLEDDKVYVVQYKTGE